MIKLRSGHPRAIVALGAHCDDIAIGAGGSLFTLCSANPGVRVDALGLSGGGTERGDEERAPLAPFCPRAGALLTVLKMPHRPLPCALGRGKQTPQDPRAA